MENIIKNINIPALKEKFEYKKSSFSSKDLIEKIKTFDYKNLDLKKIESLVKNTNRPVCFVHSDSDLTGVREKTNLILSPAYYWCKKEELEIDSLRKAKKLTESIFFGHLPNEGKFDYKATKIDGEFFFFAYDKEKILKELLAQGIKREFIGNVYFAQNECTGERICKISDRFALIHQNAMVSVMPLQYAQNPTDFDMLDLTLSNTYFKYRSTGGGAADDKNFFIPIGFILLWIIMEIVSGSSLSSDLEKLENEKSSLVKKYGLPGTSFQRKALKDKYTVINKKQNKIREIFTNITSFTTDKENYFKDISLSKKEIKAVFIYNKTEVREKLEKRLKGGSFTQSEKEITIRFKL
ncbi:MAG: hypothetical protein OIF32_03055 [Campylobacterales bacterium]|nr:hypothetical protein [Campylobacterales bacterium]